MTDKPTNPEMVEDVVEEIPPLVPPWILLSLAAVAFIAVPVSALATASFGAISWGALVVGVLLLVLTIVLAPQQAAGFLTGRSFRFGSTSIVITVFFIAFLMVIYGFVADQNWTTDVTQTDDFSLNQAARDVMAQFGADPTIPEVEILAFFTGAQAIQQTQLEPLLEDYEEASGGKVSYRFINPDRNVQAAQAYNVQPGGLVLGVRSPEYIAAQQALADGQPLAEFVPLANTESLSAFEASDQNQITNKIVEIVASGDFNVYVYEVDNGVNLTPQSGFVQTLERTNWNFQQVNLTDLTAVDTDITLNDTNLDGEVLLFAGGSSALSESEVALIQDYLDNGGSVIIAADPDGEEPSLASTEELNTYLSETFGLSFGEGIVLDPQNSVGGSIATLAIQNIRQTSDVMAFVPQQAVVILDVPRPIVTAENRPDNIDIDVGASTATISYTKTLPELIEGESQQDDDDDTGPFDVIVAAENTETGARLVLSGSASPFEASLLQGQGIANLEAGVGMISWAMGYEEFETPANLFLPELDTRPQDQPVFADPNQLATINFISLFALPFGVLIVGGVVWFTRRGS
ncbi:MAG: Gldg family protein [Chloroflexota bacterium]